jgi:hypothetical protein
MMDMKVQVYSKFMKNKIWKKMKSPSSMRNGRFPFPRVGTRFKRLERKLLKAFLKIPYSCCPPFWVDVINSCWLAPVYARPAPTSPKKFKHP